MEGRSGKVRVARGGVFISARSSVPRGRASASAAAACHHAFTLAAAEHDVSRQTPT
jgi:hypothetical protein